MLRRRPSSSSAYVAAAARVELHAGRYDAVHTSSFSVPASKRSSISVLP
jgi:hypothetical protein